MSFRCFSDIKQTPLLLGLLQILWAWIPATDQEGFLFRAMLNGSAAAFQGSSYEENSR